MSKTEPGDCGPCVAYKIACQKGFYKYFAHAGALMTADGTGDGIINWA